MCMPYTLGMKNKIVQLVTSVRFLQLVVVAVLQSLVLFSIISTEQGEGLINIISALLVGSVGIGTIDKFSAAKSGATTVSIPKNVTEVKATTKKK